MITFKGVKTKDLKIAKKCYEILLSLNFDYFHCRNLIDKLEIELKRRKVK